MQHGASTLPDELFHRFPQVETAEIHLATGFQNPLYDHPAFPRELLAEIEGWCFANAADERKDGETDTQFVYKTRKKALGPYKRELWELPRRTRSSPVRRASCATCSSSSASPARGRWSRATSGRAALDARARALRARGRLIVRWTGPLFVR